MKDDLIDRARQYVKDQEAWSNVGWRKEVYDLISGLLSALSAERADHQLTLDTFRKQEAIWNEKLAMEIAAREAAQREVEALREALIAAGQTPYFVQTIIDAARGSHEA